MIFATRASPRGRGRRGLRAPLGPALACLVAVLLAAGIGPPASGQRRWVVAFANITEEPGVTLEGTGFTGAEIRESFNLAARPLPIDPVFYDNRRADARPVANAEAAAAH